MNALHQRRALPVAQLGMSTTRRSRIHVDEIVDGAVRQVNGRHHGAGLHVRSRSGTDLGEHGIRPCREAGLVRRLMCYSRADAPIPIHFEDITTSHRAFTPRALP